MSAKPNNSIERALAIVYHCAADPAGASFSALKAVAGDVAGTTLSRILATLIECGDLVKDDAAGVYQVGPRFIQAARAALGQANIEDVLAPLLQQLALKCDEPAAYFHWDHDWMYLRLKHELPEHFSYARLGSRQHVLSHTFFRAIQSALSTAELKKIQIDVDAAYLKKIADAGYFTQTEVYRHQIFRVTAPVFYADGRVAGALGITSLINDYSQQEKQHLIHHVCASAQQASALLVRMKIQEQSNE